VGLQIADDLQKSFGSGDFRRAGAKGCRLGFFNPFIIFISYRSIPLASGFFPNVEKPGFLKTPGFSNQTRLQGLLLTHPTPDLKY
jgi:hypothetical protein